MRELELSFRPDDGRFCPVFVGRGVLARLSGELLSLGDAGRIVIVSDSNVAPLHGESFVEEMRSRGAAADLLVFPAGEAHKTRETKASLEDRLLALGAGRDAVVVALGGGVTGDLAGFLSATWHRGIRLYQAPTSLLAMVDAAVGGKTGLDLPGAKNQVGAFHRPEAVYADIDLLETLPEEPYRDAFAEIVKTAVIGDAALFGRLEGSADRLLGRDPGVQEETVLDCIRIKGAVVESDEREGGRRAVLNFGHTVGHALEAVSAYRLSHGAAVSIGMVAEARLASRDTGFPGKDRARLEALLARFGLPLAAPPGIDASDLASALAADKKNRLGTVRYAPPVRLGEMRSGDDVTVELRPDDLAEVLSGMGAPSD